MEIKYDFQTYKKEMWECDRGWEMPRFQLEVKRRQNVSLKKMGHRNMEIGHRTNVSVSPLRFSIWGPIFFFIMRKLIANTLTIDP